MRTGAIRYNSINNKNGENTSALKYFLYFLLFLFVMSLIYSIFAYNSSRTGSFSFYDMLMFNFQFRAANDLVVFIFDAIAAI
jgi:hypothetical protein